jgi:hypothetical protein
MFLAGLMIACAILAFVDATDTKYWVVGAGGGLLFCLLLITLLGSRSPDTAPFFLMWAPFFLGVVAGAGLAFEPSILEKMLYVFIASVLLFLIAFVVWLKYGQKLETLSSVF